MWKLNNVVLNNQWLNKEIKENLKKIWDNISENAVNQNLMDVAIAVLRGYV